jgi:hypothetical protein
MYTVTVPGAHASIVMNAVNRGSFLGAKAASKAEEAFPGIGRIHWDLIVRRSIKRLKR